MVQLNEAKHEQGAKKHKQLLHHVHQKHSNSVRGSTTTCLSHCMQSTRYRVVQICNVLGVYTFPCLCNSFPKGVTCVETLANQLPCQPSPALFNNVKVRACWWPITQQSHPTRSKEAPGRPADMGGSIVLLEVHSIDHLCLILLIVLSATPSLRDAARNP